MELKERIEKVLSEILSDKYDANITIRFVPRDEAQAACRREESAICERSA